MTDQACFPSLADAVEPARQPALERLRAAWWLRLQPADAAEEQVVDAIVAQYWRASRLDALEERVLVALIEDRDLGKLPTLATLLRCRARLQKERERAEAELGRLRATRPEITTRDAPVEEPDEAPSEERQPAETASAPISPAPKIDLAGPSAAEAPATRHGPEIARRLSASDAELVERARRSAEMLWSIGTVEGELDDPAAAAWLAEGERQAIVRRRAAVG
jgi:hypothetical protein